jgi:hypothetical protein
MQKRSSARDLLQLLLQEGWKEEKQAHKEEQAC